MGKSSRYKRYRDGMWLPARKAVYVYWYRFLQLAEQDTRYTVDWSKYEGWGGADTVLTTRFDDWWDAHWRDLFAVRDLGDEPRFNISTKAPKPDAYRLMRLVYERRSMLEDGNSLSELADQIGFTMDKSAKGAGFYTAVETAEQYDARRVHVFRHLRKAEKILANVALGVFPGDTTL